MGLKESLERVRVLFEGTAVDSKLAPSFPPAAIELSVERVTGVRVGRDRKTRGMAVRAAAFRPLPHGALEASLVRPNVRDTETVGRALDEVLKEVAPGEHRVSLLLPDQAARVSLLSFPEIPGTRRELLELVRFRMAKALPFKAEDAAIDLQPLGRTVGATAVPGSGTVLAVFMHRPILEQYEALLTSRGYWPGLVGLASLELFNLHRRHLCGNPVVTDQDLMLLNLTRHDLSLLIASNGQVIFFRSKALPGGTAEGPDLPAVRREIYTSLAFYQEKLLGRGLQRVWVRAAGLDAAPILDAVREESGVAVEALRLSEAMSFASATGVDEQVATLIAPAAGAVAGRRA
jgi:type IV pilus assembly protein PilM